MAILLKPPEEMAPESLESMARQHFDMGYMFHSRFQFKTAFEFYGLAFKYGNYIRDYIGGTK